MKAEWDEYLRNRLRQSEIDKGLKDFLLSGHTGIIYGAGRQAGIVYDFCMMFGKDSAYLMTSGSKLRWSSLPDARSMQHYLPDTFPYEKTEYDVMIAVGNGQHEIEAQLENAGFQHIYTAENWSDANEQLRSLFYDSYFEYHNVEYRLDEDGERYFIYKQKESEFRMYYPKDQVFRANTLGELNNIVLPSVFNDPSVMNLGPYELAGKAELLADEVVFDLGANVGLFSCTAAYKGCEVYAFEPNTHGPLQYLQKNAGLYKKIHVVPLAVGSEDCDVTFYYNQDLEKNLDICRGSLIQNKEPSYSSMKVEQITIDTFVRMKKLDRVDFIKSHIEDTELLMLQGAKETIQRFSPKLAFFYSGDTDNEYCKNIRSLLLELNAGYQFEYKWKKFFAYAAE